jgi:hypothetical protein
MSLEDKFQFLMGDSSSKTGEDSNSEKPSSQEPLTRKFEYLMMGEDQQQQPDLRPKFEFLMKSGETNLPDDTHVETIKTDINKQPIEQSSDTTIKLPPLAPINTDCDDPDNPDILAYVWTTDEKGTHRECITAEDIGRST